MLLSIVMMIKNEENYLNKTLKALLPLMNNINSELVILDTGSTDNSIEIARKYTDKIYNAKWNDNFSDMRNKSISYSSGDWILVIDADEELIECDKLIAFFNSKLYKKYNSASVELKSFSTEDEKTYSIGKLPRLFKNDSEFRYEGSIHEQPIYKEPVYNSIARFNHYGYIYDNEEVKNKKLKRNEKILLLEYQMNPEDSYICYQIGQNYAAFGQNQEALYYFKKAYEIYDKKNKTYIPVILGLAKVYLNLSMYEECEVICSEFIKIYGENIDIYYYLMLSEYNLKKYKESLKTYEKYNYLLEINEKSLQSEDYCFIEQETICYKEYAQIKLVELYYNLKSYENVIKECKKLNLTQLKEVYMLLIESLYKLDKKDEILNLYKQKSNIVSHKKQIIIELENFTSKLKLSDKEKIYLLFSTLEDNYGTLNKVRMGKTLLEFEYNQILADENQSYYGDLIYYALEDNKDIEKILKGVKYYNKQNYIEYLVENKRSCIIKLYDFLLKQKNSLNVDKLSLYAIISKILLLKGNFKNKKCETLFFMYITYRYEYLKQMYNQNLNDENLIELIQDKDDIFVIDVINIQNIKTFDKLEYIKILKNLLVENNRYTEGIQILINKFEDKLKENEELKQLKNQYKKIIENNIQSHNLDVAINMIGEYESIFDSDSGILNMKAIIYIMMQKFEDADVILKNSFILNNTDYNTIFNIAYLKECTNEIDEALRFYTKIVNNCKEEEIVLESKEKINILIKK